MKNDLGENISNLKLFDLTRYAEVFFLLFLFYLNLDWSDNH